MSVLTQCPGKRASHCYTRNRNGRRRSLLGLNALESGRVIVTKSKNEDEYQSFIVSMPWKAGESLLQEIKKIRVDIATLVSMPWKAGESLLLSEEITNALENVIVSMPWKAGESLLQTPFWRPVALGLVSPESLTYPPDPLRNQNKEFGTPFSEVVYLLFASIISLNLPHSLKSLTSRGLSAFVGLA